MMKSYTVTLFALLSASAMAAPSQPAKESAAPVGISTLKLERPSNPVREARRELEKVEKEIAQLDAELRASKGQAVAARAAQGANSGRAATFESLDRVNRVQRDQLVARRTQLQGELKSLAAAQE